MSNNTLEVIASCSICNTASLNIYLIENGIEDYIIAGINNDTPRKYKIYNTNKGSYFNSTRWYLDEFIRI